jgi:predicted DCC family thiol-disulfide oxidoreductase YuxK
VHSSSSQNSAEKSKSSSVSANDFVKTTIPCEVTETAQGWVLYDGECPLCTNAARRFDGLLHRHHFNLAPLQAAWARQRLGLKAGEPLMEMKLLAEDGRIFGGADALVQIARRIRWAWPLFVLAQIPGAMILLRAIYRRVAANRQCLSGDCRVTRTNSPGKFLPLIFLPLITLLFANKMPAWVFMWAFAFALYAGCKWLTFSMARQKSSGANTVRALGYLLAWPGMDAAGFLNDGAKIAKPRPGEWVFAVAKIISGVAVVWFGVRLVLPVNPLLAGWVGMIGIMFILHFGLFHLLSIAWRMAGVNATPVMRDPALAGSLAEFWGRRWNTAFHELVRRFTFRPLAKRAGVTVATLVVFLLSGLVHELCISLPARGGYGLPTAYFLIQGLGVVAEHTTFARWLGLQRGVRGWLFTLFVTVAPAFWLFNPTFIRNVILPMLHAIGAT